MTLRASFLFLMSAFALACGGATVAETPSEPELEVPTNVPKSSSIGASSGGASSDFSGTTQSVCPGYAGGNACEARQSVTSADDVMSIINGLPEQRVSTAKGTALLVSSDLVATRDFELGTSDITPTGCDDCQAPSFRARGFPGFDAIVGISCLEETAAQPIVRVEPACARIAIAKGTVFRVRSVIQDMHPSAPTYWHFVDFVAPCTTSCAAGVYSDRGHECFHSAYEACAYGEGLSPEYCSCRADECHQKAKGAACSFASSPDVEQSGTCGQTGCVAKH